MVLAHNCKAKILLQTLWSEKVGWDDPVPEAMVEQWSQWRKQLHVPLLSDHCIPRCYFPTASTITSIQLHGFSEDVLYNYSNAIDFHLNQLDYRPQLVAR
jgi:hypothetical protein